MKAGQNNSESRFFKLIPLFKTNWTTIACSCSVQSAARICKFITKDDLDQGFTDYLRFLLLSLFLFLLENAKAKQWRMIELDVINYEASME